MFPDSQTHKCIHEGRLFSLFFKIYFSQAIAGLLIALYPRVPLSTSDNRYHLQALRHMYVMAAERRCVVTRDIDTHELCYIPLEITLRAAAEGAQPTVIKAQAPCLLPV